jgi:hypothetical protein
MCRILLQWIDRFGESQVGSTDTPWTIIAFSVFIKNINICEHSFCIHSASNGCLCAMNFHQNVLWTLYKRCYEIFFESAMNTLQKTFWISYRTCSENLIDGSLNILLMPLWTLSWWYFKCALNIINLVLTLT